MSENHNEFTRKIRIHELWILVIGPVQVIRVFTYQPMQLAVWKRCRAARRNTSLRMTNQGTQQRRSYIILKQLSMFIPNYYSSTELFILVYPLDRAYDFIVITMFATFTTLDILVLKQYSFCINKLLNLWTITAVNTVILTRTIYWINRSGTIPGQIRKNTRVAPEVPDNGDLKYL